MIERHHETDGVRSRALWSPCGLYRYALERVWGAGPLLLYVMLNPSKADADRNDPTIERCQRRAVQLGFGAMRVANLFAWCATDPRDLRRADAPVGAGNDVLLRDWAAGADMVLAGWGAHGDHMGRGAEVAAWLPGPVHVLGLTKAGHPRHPLYVGYATPPVPWPLTQRYAKVKDD